MERQVRVLTDTRSTFEQRQCLVQVPLAEVWQAGTSIGLHKADGMLDRLGNAQPGFADGNPLGKRSHLSKAKGQIGTTLHGRKDELPKALVALLALQQGHGSPVGVYALTIGPLEA